MSKKLFAYVGVAVAVCLGDGSVAFAEGSGELNNTQQQLAEVAGIAVTDNCPCPEPDASAKEVSKYDKCIQKGPGAAAKAFRNAQKFVGAPSSLFKAAISEVVTDFDEECKASRESDDGGDETEPGEEF